MSNPTELRAKLLAQRATQQQETKRKEQIHENAKIATKNMVLLGYNFDDILELVKSEVSEGYLDEMFRSIGIIRKRKYTRKVKLTPFGASRWLDYEDNYVIRLDEEDEEEEEEAEDVEASRSNVEPPKATEAKFDPVLSSTTTSLTDVGKSPFLETNNNNEDSEMQVTQEPVKLENAEADGHNEATGKQGNVMSDTSNVIDLTENSPTKTQESQVIDLTNSEIGVEQSPGNDSALADKHSVSHVTEPELASGDAMEVVTVSLPTSQNGLGGQSEELKGDVNEANSGEVDVIMAEADHPNIPVENKESKPSSVGSMTFSSWEPSWATDYESPGQVEPATFKEPEVSEEHHDDVKMTDTVDPQYNAVSENLENGHQSNDATMSQASDPTEEIHTDASGHTGPFSNTVEEHVEDEPAVGMERIVPDEEAVQRELLKVQTQIREMQELKLAREAQREATAEMNRRNMELRDIAAKRALLIQTRSTLDVGKMARNVEDLERKLEAAKKRMFDTRKLLGEVDKETLELEARELKLREELSRPRPVSAKENSTVDSTQANSGYSETAAKDAVKDAADGAIAEMAAPVPIAFQYPVPTARESPLRAFSSFRMCPSLGPSHWFSKTFNGRFVNDLASREMCPDEIKGKPHKTSRSDCEYVHFSDFDIAPLEICEYMASRQIDRPGYREGLIEAVEKHLAPETSPEHIAASIIGFSRKYDPSQILDWQGWGIERPL